MLGHIEGFEYLLNFLGYILSYLSLLQEGKTAEFPPFSSSHIRQTLLPDDKFTVIRATVNVNSPKRQLCVSPSDWTSLIPWSIKNKISHFTVICLPHFLPSHPCSMSVTLREFYDKKFTHCCVQFSPALKFSVKKLWWNHHA